MESIVGCSSEGANSIGARVAVTPIFPLFVILGAKARRESLLLLLKEMFDPTGRHVGM